MASPFRCTMAEKFEMKSKGVCQGRHAPAGRKTFSLLLLLHDWIR